MSGQPFSFPPPPPPPPPSVAFQPPPGHSQPAYGHYGPHTRGSNGSRANPRAGHRGGQRYGQYGRSQSVNHSSGNHTGRGRYNGSQSSNYTSHGSGYANNRYPLPNYPSVQQPQYPPNLRQSYGQHLPNYFQTTTGTQQYSDDKSINGQQPQIHGGEAPLHSIPLYSMHSHQERNPQPSPQAQVYQTTRSDQNGFVSHPPPMGPPMHLGFNVDQYDQQAQHSPQLTATGTPLFHNGPASGGDPLHRQKSPPNHRYGESNRFPGYRGRGSNRGRGEALGRSQNNNSMTRAAPAVPSFGGPLPLPLPLKPPSSTESSRRPRRKRRKHNQLGLTPKTEEHESSEEEEDDADEESKLAASANTASSGGQL